MLQQMVPKMHAAASGGVVLGSHENTSAQERVEQLLQEVLENVDVDAEAELLVSQSAKVARNIFQKKGFLFRKRRSIHKHMRPWERDISIYKHMRPHRRGSPAYTNICALIGEDHQNILTYAPSWERIVKPQTQKQKIERHNYISGLHSMNLNNSCCKFDVIVTRSRL